MTKYLIPLIALIVFAGCKYEDGPKLSLRSKKARAVNTWYIDEVYENGVNKTSDYKNAYVNYSMTIKDDNKYELKYRPFNVGDYTETGEWSFSGDKQYINFGPQGGSGSSRWKILRLKETETWVIQTIDGKDVELRMKD